ncbi:MAG TPA: tRNA lysidine(34) synthetase, partial [Acidimicrobiia bacterium]|nr:tRNA lysidine(34) synthetase [Acidimicrobiia bacterium]
MAATRRLNELVVAALSRLELPPDAVTVALSGGADSAALAYLALQSGADVALLHINHGFDASDRLADAAERIAVRLGKPLRKVDVEVAAGPSPEAKARDARYAVFDEVEGVVVTGHTRDDSVETMLINLIRGTGIDGLRGIPYHRSPRVFRPMLNITRDATREI